MISWNLPPGCNDSDIPGNNPKDWYCPECHCHFEEPKEDCLNCPEVCHPCPVCDCDSWKRELCDPDDFVTCECHEEFKRGLAFKEKYLKSGDK